MRPRQRTLGILFLGLVAAVGVGFAALEPLRQADRAADAVWEEIATLRDAIAALAPDEPEEGPGATSRAMLLGHLDRAEDEFAARREAIVQLAALQLSIALAAATFAFWLAITLARRGGQAVARAEAAARSTGEAIAPAPSAPPPTPVLPARAFLCDPSGRLLRVNETVAHDFGASAESFVGAPVSSLFAPGAREAIDSIIAAIGPERPSAQVDITVGAAGREQWLRLRLHARIDESDTVTEISAEGRTLSPETVAAEHGSAEPARAIAIPIAASGEGESAGEKPPEPAPEPSRLAGTRILVALGGPDQRRLVGFLLGQIGARITMVQDGHDLLETIERSPRDRFDVIVLEPRLAAVDGLAVVRILRERSVEIPVVALVPRGDERLRESCLEEGCRGAAPTPIDRRTLAAVLTSVLPEREQTPGPERSTPELTPS